MIPLLISTALLLAFQALAQQASGSWRKPNITVSRADRITTAESALGVASAVLSSTNALFPDPGNSYGLAGTFYSQLAEFDLATDQQKYGATLQQYFLLASINVAELGAVNFTGEFLNDGLNYGHAAAMAYVTYKNPVFLAYAQEVWWAIQKYTLSEADLTAGSMALKNFTLRASCQGVTMAGGTFREKLLTSPDLNAGATGGYLVLSALLAEATNDKMYLDAAQQSAEFMHAHLFNVQAIVQDTISARLNDSCGLSQETVLASYNSGLLLEGLAIIYSITQDAATHDLIAQIVTGAVPYTGWQGANGIIANGAAKSSDMLLPRALATVLARNATTPALQAYIEAYLAVQYNAVVDLATTPGSNIYAGTWNGPPSLSFSPGNQTNAIQVLLSAINLGTETTTSNSGSSSTSLPAGAPSTTPSVATAVHKASKAGPIAGGVVGGILLLLLLAVVAFLWRRREHKRAAEFNNPSPMGPPAIAPPINAYDLRFNGAPSSMSSPQTTQYYPSVQSPSDTDNSTTQLFGAQPPSLTHGSTSNYGSTSQYGGSVSDHPTSMGEMVGVGVPVRYPVNVDNDDDLPPDYPATEIARRMSRRTGKLALA